MTQRDAESIRGSYAESIRGRYAKDIKNAVHNPHQPENVSHVQEHFKNTKGVNLDPDFIRTHGAVVGIDGKFSAGSVSNEGSYPTGNRRQHEGIHHLFNEIHRAYGEDTANHARQGVDRLIHPGVAGTLNTYLGNINYAPNTHENERVTHLYEMLHDPKVRDTMRQMDPEFARNEREIMGHAKKSWGAIRGFAEKMRAK